MLLNEIKYLYPSASNDDFLLQDNSDGNGALICWWNTEKLGVKPTLEQLAAVSSAADLEADQELSNKSILRQILTIEAIQGRAIREHALGFSGARERLLAIDDSIWLLRSRLINISQRVVK